MPDTERPLIGINGLLVPGDSPALRLATRYADAVLRAGGIPVALAPVGGPQDVARLLARIDGLSIEEVARRMNRSPNAVSHILLRALRKLRESLGDTESLHLPDRRFAREEGGDGD